MNDFHLKGPIPSPKIKIGPGTKNDNSYKSILFVKPWNSIGNRWCRTPTLSGGAPLSIMCPCLQSKRDVSCSVIMLNIPCR